MGHDQEGWPLQKLTWMPISWLGNLRGSHLQLCISYTQLESMICCLHIVTPCYPYLPMAFSPGFTDLWFLMDLQLGRKRCRNSTRLIYPLVNVYKKTMENHHAIFIGKSTIFMCHFPVRKLWNYQRVSDHVSLNNLFPHAHYSYYTHTQTPESPWFSSG